MPPADKSARKTRILDAAERAFADSGFAGASLRRIVRDARVNLATVYYYFGSKQGLMQAVFQRRFGPLREQRMNLLRSFEAAAQSAALPPEKVIEAMLTPLLLLAVADSSQSRITMRLIGRVVTEPSRVTHELLRKQHREVREAFLTAMRRSLPELPPADLRWRMQFVWGALAFTLANPQKIRQDTAGMCDPTDSNQVLPQMTAFFAAGLRAPATSATCNHSAKS
jgi:AcrR family transcriptional regulator